MRVAGSGDPGVQEVRVGEFVADLGCRCGRTNRCDHYRVRRVDRGTVNRNPVGDRGVGLVTLVLGVGQVKKFIV